MTGFGRAEATGERWVVSVEARSVNHRHLDVTFKMPRFLNALEAECRRMVQDRFERGRIEVYATAAPAGGQPSQQLSVDSTLARRYAELAREVAAELSLSAPVPLEWVLDRPGVIRMEEPDPVDPTSVWPLLARALAQALDEVRSRREAEGEALAAELRTLHEALVTEVGRMALRVPQAVIRREDRLRARLQALLADATVDQNRVLTEVGIWADKTDIAEELARLRAHLEQFALMLKDGGSLGRPLDFLIQELNREVNTIASKADDLALSQAAIAAKGLLEKVREQAQNLE